MKINSKENNRPIALASIISKVFESVILNRIEGTLTTNFNQFGFKKNHSTDTCIYALKDMLHCYRSMSSCVFVCFIDA